MRDSLLALVIVVGVALGSIFVYLCGRSAGRTAGREDAEESAQIKSVQFEFAPDGKRLVTFSPTERIFWITSAGRAAGWQCGFEDR